MSLDGPESWPKNNSRHQCLVFYRINGMSLQGSGVIDGRGEKWWDLPYKPHKGPNGTTLTRPCDSPIKLEKGVQKLESIVREQVTDLNTDASDVQKLESTVQEVQKLRVNDQKLGARAAQVQKHGTKNCEDQKQHLSELQKLGNHDQKLDEAGSKVQKLRNADSQDQKLSNKLQKLDTSTESVQRLATLKELDL